MNHERTIRERDFIGPDPKKHLRIARDLNEAIIANLTDEEFSDLQVLFYVGRGNEFGEYYDQMLINTVEEQRSAKSRGEGVRHIMSKTNLLDNVIRGCEIVGRPTLASKLRALAPVIEG